MGCGLSNCALAGKVLENCLVGDVEFVVRKVRSVLLLRCLLWERDCVVVRLLLADLVEEPDVVRPTPRLIGVDDTNSSVLLLRTFFFMAAALDGDAVPVAVVVISKSDPGGTMAKLVALPRMVDDDRPFSRVVLLLPDEVRNKFNNSSLLVGNGATGTVFMVYDRARSTLVKAERTSKSCLGNGACRLMKSSKFFCCRFLLLLLDADLGLPVGNFRSAAWGGPFLFGE